MSDIRNGVEGSIVKVCNDDGCEEKHMPAEFYAVSHPLKSTLLSPELIFGATGATGGRVKFLSAV